MKLEEKKFRVRNEDFVCDVCHAKVSASKKGTPRNHCPFCLHSKHVDINPGDRKNPCGGKLKPVGLRQDTKKGYIIFFKCERCQFEGKNRAATDDNFDLLIQLLQATNQ